MDLVHRHPVPARQDELGGHRVRPPYAHHALVGAENQVGMAVLAPNEPVELGWMHVGDHGLGGLARHQPAPMRCKAANGIDCQSGR